MLLWHNDKMKKKRKAEFRGGESCKGKKKRQQKDERTERLR